jgi:hypothetical protein
MTEIEDDWQARPTTSWRAIIWEGYLRLGARLSSLEYWFVITGLGFIHVIGYETGALSPPTPPKDIWIALLLYLHIPLSTAFTVKKAAERLMEEDE